jgi:hypothetical protein
MCDLRFSVTEAVHRHHGQIVEIVYEYEEMRQEQIEENMQARQETRERTYHASIKRDHYERMLRQLQGQRDALPFDSFVQVLRPFMMGTYAADEIREAFRLLDRNRSNTIDVEELSAFFPVIHPFVDKTTIRNYINKVTNSVDQQINFDEFNQLVLRGIGRDIVCGHI